MNLHPVALMSVAGSMKPQEAVEIPIKRRRFLWNFPDDFPWQSRVVSMT